MSYKIDKVAVLGEGVKATQLAAHLSNADIEVYAYDMTQDIAEKGLESCKKLKPSPFYNPKTVDLISPCNYNDHLEKLSECDWVIEVISERLDWKQDLYKKITPYILPNINPANKPSGEKNPKSNIQDPNPKSKIPTRTNLASATSPNFS